MKPQIPLLCSTSSVCGAHGELWSTEFTFCSVPFGDTGSCLTCTEESGVSEGVLPEDWNGDDMFTGTEAPRGSTEEDKVSKRGRREPEGIKSAAIWDLLFRLSVRTSQESCSESSEGSYVSNGKRGDTLNKQTKNKNVYILPLNSVVPRAHFLWTHSQGREEFEKKPLEGTIETDSSHLTIKASFRKSTILLQLK